MNLRRWSRKFLTSVFFRFRPAIALLIAVFLVVDGVLNVKKEDTGLVILSYIGALVWMILIIMAGIMLVEGDWFLIMQRIRKVFEFWYRVLSLFCSSIVSGYCFN